METDRGGWGRLSMLWGGGPNNFQEMQTSMIITQNDRELMFLKAFWRQDNARKSLTTVILHLIITITITITTIIMTTIIIIIIIIIA